MARKFSESVISPVIESPVGHEVSYVFSTQHLLNPIYSLCDVNCHEVPTSWLIEIRIRKHPHSNMATLHVSLMRLDYMDSPVNAIIEFNAYDDEDRILSDAARSFRRDGMLTGHVLNGTFQGIALLPEMTNIFQEELFVSFALIFLNCHLEKTEGNDISESSDIDIIS